MFIELALDVAVSAQIDIYYYDAEQGTWSSLASYVTAFVFAVLIVAVVALMLRVACCQAHRIKNEEDPKFQLMYEVVWEGQKDLSKGPPLFQIFFMVRRVVYAVLLITPYEYEVSLVLQIFAVIALNCLSMIYVASSRPFASRTANRIEAFNEWINLNVSGLLVLMQKEVDHANHYKLGLVNNFFVLFLVIVNLAVVVYGSFFEIRGKCRRWLFKRAEKKRLAALGELAEGKEEAKDAA